jgi:hypothetical protein
MLDKATFTLALVGMLVVVGSVAGGVIGAGGRTLASTGLDQ